LEQSDDFLEWLVSNHKSKITHWDRANSDIDQDTLIKRSLTTQRTLAGKGGLKPTYIQEKKFDGWTFDKCTYIISYAASNPQCFSFEIYSW